MRVVAKPFPRVHAQQREGKVEVLLPRRDGLRRGGGGAVPAGSISSFAARWRFAVSTMAGRGRAGGLGTDVGAQAGAGWRLEAAIPVTPAHGKLAKVGVWKGGVK